MKNYVNFKTFVDEDSEKSILAFLLTESKDLKYKTMLVSRCKSEFFTVLRKDTFNVISSLVRENINPTCEIVCEKFPQGFTRFQLEEIKDCNALYSNYGYYIKKLSDNAKRRSFYNILCTLLNTVNDNPNFDADEVLQEVTHEISGITNEFADEKIYSIGECMVQVTEDISERMKPNYKSSRILTGLNCLDSKMGGLAPSEVTVIGARPSQGKTALALTMFRNIILSGTPAGFISLEMSRESLSYRLASMQTGFSQFKLQHLPTDEATLAHFGGRISQIGDVQGFIADTPNAPLYEVELTAKRLVSEFDVKVIFIDYAGLIGRNPDEARAAEYERQSEVSKRIKGLARSLDIPIVLLVQLNREAQEKPATLANIRGSGSYEQDADVIIFIQKDKDIGDYLSVAKNRNGETGNARVIFHKEITLFSDCVGGKA
mgnify:CR=1 FL=1